MAAAHQRGAGWVLARPLRQPRTGTPPPKQATLPRSRGSSAACRRQARSSSPLRGSGRSSLTPGRAARRPGQLRGRTQKNSQPSPAARLVTGSGSHAPLTLVALMGADERALRPDAYAHECIIIHDWASVLTSQRQVLRNLFTQTHRARFLPTMRRQWPTNWLWHERPDPPVLSVLYAVWVYRASPVPDHHCQRCWQGPCSSQLAGVP